VPGGQGLSLAQALSDITAATARIELSRTFMTQTSA
jgi:hypothetical protein